MDVGRYYLTYTTVKKGIPLNLLNVDIFTLDYS